MKLLRPAIILLGLLALWQAVVILSGAPPYILPGPWPSPKPGSSAPNCSFTTVP